MTEFEKILFTPTIGASLTVSGVLISLGFALLLGFVISLGYIAVNRRNGYSSYFVTSLLILPAVISVIILMIGSNIARAFSLGGVFALIRFRSEPGNPRDITYVCVTMAAGLACGTGYIGYGVIFTLLITLVFIIVNALGFGTHKNSAVVLKVTVPEDIDFETAFDEIFKEYTKYHKLDRVKTADFGALFQLQFRTELKDDSKRKEFIDALRTVNSNLTVSMSNIAYEEGRKTF